MPGWRSRPLGTRFKSYLWSFEVGVDRGNRVAVDVLNVVAICDLNYPSVAQVLHHLGPEPLPIHGSILTARTILDPAFWGTSHLIGIGCADGTDDSEVWQLPDAAKSGSAS